MIGPAFEDPSPFFNIDPDILHVPGDHPTIQAAIKAAKNGDIVIVYPGTYYENINFSGKLIKLIGRDGPQFTVIDGGDNPDPDGKSTVTFNSGEGVYATIAGFTITNGAGTESLPLGYHCGGGIFCYNSSPTITNNVIVHNMAGEPPPDKKTVGGAHSSCGINGSFIDKKEALPEAVNPQNSTIHNPSNIGMGGGIACYLSEARIINNLIAYNVAESKGGAIACRQSEIRLVNNTVTENIARTGGSVYASDLSRVTIIDCIFWSNEAMQGREWSIRSFCTFTVSFTDLQGSTGSVELGPNSVINWGSGIIDADPLFVAGPEGDYYMNQIAGHFSPCVNKGSSYAEYLGFNTCWTNYEEIPDSGLVDMGFHYGPHAPIFP